MVLGKGSEAGRMRLSMGTRTNIHFCSGDLIEANIYRHSDGYPEGVLPDLQTFFEGLLAKPVFFVDACCECGKIGVSGSDHTKYSHHRGPRVGGFLGKASFYSNQSIPERESTEPPLPLSLRVLHPSL